MFHGTLFFTADQLNKGILDRETDFTQITSNATLEDKLKA